MIPQDLATIVPIETRLFPSPWNQHAFLQELEIPQALSLVSVQGSREEIVGYLCCRIFLDEFELLKIAVAPSFHGNGIGSHLLSTALRKGREQGAKSAFLEVEQGNHAAISLYARHGFSASGIRKGYYANGEDAVNMQLSFREIPFG